MYSALQIFPKTYIYDLSTCLIHILVCSTDTFRHLQWYMIFPPTIFRFHSVMQSYLHTTVHNQSSYNIYIVRWSADISKNSCGTWHCSNVSYHSKSNCYFNTAFTVHHNVWHQLYNKRTIHNTLCTVIHIINTILTRFDTLLMSSSGSTE
jgi:hypothetical protein